MKKMFEIFYKIFKRTELTAQEEQEVIGKIIKKIKEN